MSLTKEQRDALNDSDFAVPETRELVMHDIPHTKMAWNNVDEIKGLSAEQRASAKERILLRAAEQGINTSDWNITDINTARQKITISFEAMAIQMPEVQDHPNLVPFSGILTRIDEPSDAPVGGAGHRIIIPKAVAEKALDSLALMGVDFKPDFDGHDARRKIGVIKEAHIVGNAIEIKGFFYGADFPKEVKRIQAEKSLLGFSYEAQAQVGSMSDDIWTISNCIFTGAAVLYKDKAAYQSTALAASKVESEEMSKTNEDILSILKEMKEDNSAIKKEIAELKANAEKKEESKSDASLVSKVAPHAEAIRIAAANMTAAGMESIAKSLNKIADHMVAEAAAGRSPNACDASEIKASADKKSEIKDPEIEKLKAQLDADLATVKTHIEDLKKQKFEAAKEPERKTIPVSAEKLLQKIGLNASEDHKFTVQQIDNALKDKNLNTRERMGIKTSLLEAQMIAN